MWDFNETWIFWTDFRKILISNFVKIHPLGAEFHVDERTGKHSKNERNLIVALRSFADAPQKHKWTMQEEIF